MSKQPPKFTPAKKPFAMPNAALQAAVEKEWAEFETFSPSAMPLSSMLFTAIDQVDGNNENMVEVLMAYVDTETLCYRSQKPEMLEQQKKQWDPLLVWAGSRFNALWQTTTGIMPIEQPKALHEAIRAALTQLDTMQLTACGMLASSYSSLILALAVLEKRITAQQAFALSRLEETLQAQVWGDDESAAEKAKKMQEEIMGISHFLDLLEQS